MASKSKAAPIKLPSGFKAIEKMGNFWVGRKPGDTFQGKLKSSKAKDFPKTKDYAASTRNVYTFEAAVVNGEKQPGAIEITQSGGLGALELVKKGQQVFIVFLGMKKLPGKSPMREYQVAVK